MFGLTDAVAGHVRAAEALARTARLDVVQVGHLLAAMCQRPSWFRERLGSAAEADAIARAILVELGTGDGGIPAWSEDLREVFERASGPRGTVEETYLVAALAL